MKHKSTLCLALVAVSIVFSSCLRDDCKSVRSYVRYDPVYLTLEQIRIEPTVEAPRAMQRPGKLYVYGDYLFINEIREGIHVIDNSDPANPRPLAFWRLPGNVDMAIRDHYLYADQYIDLVTLDIANLEQPTLACRQENVFQALGVDPQRGLLVDYLETDVTEEVACNDSRFGQRWFMEGDVLFANADASTGGTRNNSSVPSGTGIAGSYARFAQVDNFLYIVDQSSLRTYSVTTPSCPAFIEAQQIGWNIETIFPYEDRLFVGSQNGVFIFNNSNPQRPVLEANFQHARACDPVVCDGDYAFVTLHDGTFCEGFANQLDVIDIRNLPMASLSRTFAMKHPQGLTVTSDYLYVCDDGLKVYDKTNAPDLVEKKHLPGRETYDAIALDDTLLLVIGPDGFTQYDITDPVDPQELSFIAVQK
jgi:hypothetical protein